MEKYNFFATKFLRITLFFFPVHVFFLKNNMSEKTRNAPIELSVKDLQMKKSHNNKKKPLPIQTSNPKNAVKIKPLHIPIHFTWALILTILCFFVIGPCWALYKTFELRRLIAAKELDVASRLSSKISAVLVISTIIGVFAWVAVLFCSVGLLLTGTLLSKRWI
jgi:hypothetical protein